MSDTPRTDARELAISIENEDSCCAIYVKVHGKEYEGGLVDSDFARQLECENGRLREALRICVELGTQHSASYIRRGLYNYRAYNVQHFPKGWAVRDEDGKPWHSPISTLKGVCRMIDRIEDNGAKIEL